MYFGKSLLYEGRRQRTIVVMLQLDAWDEIDGDTVEALLHTATSHFPAPALVTLARGALVMADYDVWKTKVLNRQSETKD